ncbi:hypothetical protein JW992_02380, partial [candidate division KSB1 bacterium]|nr:hypothetical protein [candidate division KSB1 bacterium]
MPSTRNRSAKLSWQAAVPMVTNPFFVWDLAKVFALTALILALILSLIQLASPAPGFWRMCWLIPLLVCSGLYALTLFISLTVFFNRYWVRFTLDEDGVL